VGGNPAHIEEEAATRLIHQTIDYHLLGWVVIAAMALTLVQMRNVDKMVKRTAKP
jgi:hypothetical protein